MNKYEKPQIEVVGTLHELTLAGPGNKVGAAPDVYANPAIVVGSLVALP